MVSVLLFETWPLFTVTVLLYQNSYCDIISDLATIYSYCVTIKEQLL